MYYVLGFLSLFLLVPLLGTLLGLLMPKLRRTTRSILLPAPRPKVWTVLSDFASQAAWRSEIKAICKAKSRSGKPAWCETLRDHRKFVFVTTELDAPRRLVRELEDERPSVNGRWIYELEAEGEQTRLRLTEECVVPIPALRTRDWILRVQSKSVTALLASIEQRFAKS